MDADLVAALLAEALTTTLAIAGPLLLLSLVVGLAISIVQAATQIQEMTLVFVPKMAAVLGGLLFLGGFMLDTLVRFTLLVFDLASRAGA
jgi:flagellar biosynthetic protein FliQ